MFRVMSSAKEELRRGLQSFSPEQTAYLYKSNKIASIFQTVTAKKEDFCVAGRRLYRQGGKKTPQVSTNYFVHFSMKVDVHFSILEKVNKLAGYISGMISCARLSVHAFC